MSGAGNDFIVIDNRFYRFPSDELSAFAVRFCPRRTGIGADGLLALCRPEGEDSAAHYRMRYFNADGSLGTMCGNGARCLARFAREAGLQAEPLLFDTDAGRHRADVPETPDAEVTIHLPVPERFSPNLIPDSGGKPIHFIWTGTEHLVQFVEHVDGLDVETTGRRLRSDTSLSPTGANVNFVECLSGSEIRVRTFEKGVEAETLACGTGSVAAALTTAILLGSDAARYRVQMPGGTLTIGWAGSPEAPEAITLKGPADIIYRGTLEL